MSAMLAEMSSGFANPVHGAHGTFRAVLDALSRPGTPEILPPAALAGLDPPSPLDCGTAAVLLALLDPETTLCATGPCNDAGVAAYLRFHTGVRTTKSVGDAAFIVVDAADLDERVWTRLQLGSDDVPQDGATLIVRVESLWSAGDGTRPLLARGPGIEHETRIDVVGPSPAFWDWRMGLQADLPRGVDVLFVATAEEHIRVLGLPRSTRIRIED